MEQFCGSGGHTKPIIEKFRFHISEFKIPGSNELDLFSDFLESVSVSGNVSLECSCKILGKSVMAQRFNIWFRDREHFSAVLVSIVSLFRKYSNSCDFMIDRSRMQELLHAIDMGTVRQIILGIDLRETHADSRLKIWFISDYSESLLDSLIASFPKNSTASLSKGMMSGELLFGFDFYPSGRIDTKIYPLYAKEDIAKLVHLGLVPDNAHLIRRLESSCPFHISSKDSVDDRIYHLRPEDEQGFISDLGNPVISIAYASISGAPGKNKLIISIEEKELVSGNVTSANIYY